MRKAWNGESLRGRLFGWVQVASNKEVHSDIL